MVKVVDDRSIVTSKDLSDRELLLVINEKVQTLNEKVDELKQDYVTKYGVLENQLKALDEKQTKDLKCVDDSLKKEIHDLQKWHWMIYGVLIFLSFLVTWLVSIYHELR